MSTALELLGAVAGVLTYKQNDTLPVITATLLDDTGALASVVGATAIKLKGRDAITHDAFLDGSCTLTNPAVYTPLTGDFGTVREIDVEVEVTTPAGVQTYPGGGYARIKVVDDVS